MKTLLANVKKFKKFIIQIVALFVLTVLDAIGGASLIGQKASVGIAFAGILAIAKVARSIAKSLADDGVVTEAEFDAAIAEAMPKDETPKA